jgi:hypothetical protein
MASWKIVPDPSEGQIEHTPFLDSRNFFAVDASGSTGFNNGIGLTCERAFVDATPGSGKARIAKWGSECNPPVELSKVKWKSDLGGTRPSAILQKEEALKCLKQSDCWYLLTDGQVYGHDVSQLAEISMQRGIMNVPVVFVIVGSRGITPEKTVCTFLHSTIQMPGSQSTCIKLCLSL